MREQAAAPLYARASDVLLRYRTDIQVSMRNLQSGRSDEFWIWRWTMRYPCHFRCKALSLPAPYDTLQAQMLDRA